MGQSAINKQHSVTICEAQKLTADPSIKTRGTAAESWLLYIELQSHTIPIMCGIKIISKMSMNNDSIQIQIQDSDSEISNYD